MQLLIVRHAIAEDRNEFASTGKPDNLRLLTSKGRKKMTGVTRGLMKLFPKVDVLATSPYLRAAETAEIIGKSYDVRPIRLLELSATSAPEDFFPWLKSKPKNSAVAVVGHEPYLGKLVSWLLSGRKQSFIELRKGGVCLLNFSGKVEPGKAALLWLLKPSQLRRLHGK